MNANYQRTQDILTVMFLRYKEACQNSYENPQESFMAAVAKVPKGSFIISGEDLKDTKGLYLGGVLRDLDVIYGLGRDFIEQQYDFILLFSPPLEVIKELVNFDRFPDKVIK